MESLQAREIKRNSLRARWANGGRGRRTDEPGRFLPHRRIKAVLPLKGTVAASDAFFPFPDGVEEIAKVRRDGNYSAGGLGAGPGSD